MEITKLDNQQLILATKDAVRKEKDQTHKVLGHLQEIDRRRLYWDFHCSSLHEYCCQELGYTSGEAQYRVAAIKLMRGSVKIEAAVMTGELSLSNAVLVNNFLSQMDGVTANEIKEDVVEKCKNKTKSQAKDILTNSPKSQKNKIIDDEIKVLMNKLTHLMGKQKVKEMLETTLSESEAKLEKSAQRAPQKTSGRVVPAATMAKLKLRAQGQCEYIDEKGRRCCQTTKLTVEHVVPFAVGGGHELNNLKIFCAGHNQRAAMIFYGARKMESFLYRSKVLS